MTVIQVSLLSHASDQILQAKAVVMKASRLLFLGDVSGILCEYVFPHHKSPDVFFIALESQNFHIETSTRCVHPWWSYHT
jgi:hypothetical protein